MRFCSFVFCELPGTVSFGKLQHCDGFAEYRKAARDQGEEAVVGDRTRKPEQIVKEVSQIP